MASGCHVGLAARRRGQTQIRAASCSIPLWATALSDDGETLRTSLAAVLAGSGSLPTALSLLAWYVFAPQCLATLSVVRRELHSLFWPTAMFVFLTALVYGAAFATYQTARVVFGG